LARVQVVLRLGVHLRARIALRLSVHLRARIALRLGVHLPISSIGIRTLEI
jgi:hypothetical protein